MTFKMAGNTFLCRILVAASILAGVSASPAVAGIVKQSNSGICHDEASPWYDKTRNYRSYGTMQECLSSGRVYSGYSGSAAKTTGNAPPLSGVTRTRYERELYDHWIDADGDCQNARHEILQDLATGRVTLSRDGCTVIRGRWNDPYTGRIFTVARDMDIDHMVPLAWAHAHGADRWGAEKRRQFANDPVNLFAVDAGTNRSKGARGPLEWLPPNESFRCEYVTRFHRIVRTYGLTYSTYEKKQMDMLRSELCR